MTLVPVHVAGGLIGIVSGLIALFARKGGLLHRRSGIVFVYAMLSMAVSGAVMAATRAQPANILAGVMTTYLVVTSLAAVRATSPLIRRVELGTMIAAFALGTGCVLVALRISAGSGPGRALAAPLLLYAIVALLGATGDLRMIRAGRPGGAARLKRHLWRMCFALFVATGSFFLGPVRRIPVPLRLPVLRLIPLVVVITMLFWLWRLRTRRVSRAAGVPILEAV